MRWFRVINLADAVMKVANFSKAVYQLSLTARRNSIGQNQLDEMLRARARINGALLQIADTAPKPRA